MPTGSVGRAAPTRRKACLGRIARMDTLRLIDNVRRGRDVDSSVEALYVRAREVLLPRIERRITGNLRTRVDADDVFHDAFLRALGSLEVFEPAGENAFYAWIYSIAKNRLIDLSRRRSVANAHFVQGESAIGPHASRIADLRRTAASVLLRRERIDGVLSRLRIEDAAIIRLHQLEEKSFEEIATLWEKTPGAIQRMFSRAVARFREIVEDEEPRP
jgi:RNA polymerase sigma factor (sigma-70 family)